MKKWTKPLPRYLLNKHAIIASLTFTVFFAIVFINLYTPFSETSWFHMGDSYLFIHTVFFFLLSFLILILSRVILFRTKYLFSIKIFQYVLWCASELYLICIVYTAFTVKLGYLHDLSVIQVFTKAFLYGVIALIFPQLLSIMYWVILDRDRKILMLNYSNVISDEPEKMPSNDKITIMDSNGTIKLSVKSENLFYIESDDNYIKVWYKDANSGIHSYLVRCRLKTVEENFLDTSLVRCHRKYIVNMDKVKILSKQSDGYYLDFDCENLPTIPITKTYEKSILAKYK